MVTLKLWHLIVCYMLPIVLSVYSIVPRWKKQCTSNFLYKDMPSSWNIGFLLSCIITAAILMLFVSVLNTYCECDVLCMFIIALPFAYTLLPFFLTIILCRLFISCYKNNSKTIKINECTSNSAPIFGGVAFVLSSLAIYITTFYIYLLFCKDKDYITMIVMYVVVLVSFALIGFIDDRLKRKSSNGMSGKLRFCLECLISIVVYLQVKDVINSVVNIPYIGQVDFGIFFIPWFVFIITGTANAVNLTNGFNGLVIVPIVLILILFNIIVPPFLPGHGYPSYCAVLTLPLIFSCLGFLTLNTKPAKIFMGDTGSLALGGAIGYTALVLKCEFALAFIGLIFVLETLSVIIQVVSFKLHKKRVFKMAPLHHNFELLGWSETKIVLSAWITSFILFLIYVTLFYNVDYINNIFKSIFF